MLQMYIYTNAIRTFSFFAFFLGELPSGRELRKRELRNQHEIGSHLTRIPTSAGVLNSQLSRGTDSGSGSGRTGVRADNTCTASTASSVYFVMKND